MPMAVTARRHGFTMVELLITLTIGAILLAMAVPQMREFIERKRVSGAATELASDIRLARAMLLQHNQPIWISFGSTGDYTCYVMYTEGNQTGFCNCARGVAAMCDAGVDPPVPLRSVFIKRNTGVTITSTAPDLRFVDAGGAPQIAMFEYGNAVAEVGSNLGGRLKVTLHGLTRAVICSISGHTSEFGDCP